MRIEDTDTMGTLRWNYMKRSILMRGCGEKRLTPKSGRTVRKEKISSRGRGALLQLDCCIALSGVARM